nr:MAG TPA: hypothetical protein [Caudoviricetes sp.]
MTDSKISVDEFQPFVAFSLSCVKLYLPTAVKSKNVVVSFQIALNPSQS